MDRQIKGIVAATLAAPYVAIGLMAVVTAIVEARNICTLLNEAFLESLFAVGTIALIWTTLPMLFLSVLAAGILNMLKVRSWIGSMIAGSLIGLCFGAFLSGSSFQHNISLLLILMLSGAICGWIHWIIAIRQTPDKSGPITTP